MWSHTGRRVADTPTPQLLCQLVESQMPRPHLSVATPAAEGQVPDSRGEVPPWDRTNSAHSSSRMWPREFLLTITL